MNKRTELTKPVISIVIPVYNVEKYLHECIESVRKQTVKNIEIILIDDGSTDRSGEICDEYEAKDERILVVHQKNQGAASARNRGIELAKGEYIGFIDSDDWIDLHMYEALLGGFSEENIDIVCSGMNIYRSKGDISEIKYVEENIILKGDEASKLLLRRKFSSSCCNKLFKRKLFEKKRFDTGKTNEDFKILFYIFLQLEKVCVIKDSFYYYRRNQKSVTSGINNIKIFDLYYNACECYEYTQNYKKELERDAFDYMIFQARFFLLKMINDNKIKEFKKQYNDILKMLKNQWLYILLKSRFSLKETIYFLYVVIKSKYEE